ATRSAQHRQARSLGLAIEHWSKLELKPTTRTATFMLSSALEIAPIGLLNSARWVASFAEQNARIRASSAKFYHHRDLRNRSNTTNRHSRSRHTSALEQQNCKPWDDQ
ncbi:hypothetical protein D6C76_06935, partial [Aureobasidium pullulans]